MGCGPDSLDSYKQFFRGITKIDSWDKPQGDAQLLKTCEDNKYDFLHSSHCFEHLNNIFIGMENWIRVVKPNGYLIITIPEESMYEHLEWPSRYNSDHKWSFTIYDRIKRLPKSINVLELCIMFSDFVEVISMQKIEDFYDFNLGSDVDQTQRPNTECAIELILRKK